MPSFEPSDIKLRRLHPGTYIGVDTPEPMTMVAGGGSWTLTIGPPKDPIFVRDFGSKKFARAAAAAYFSREDLTRIVRDDNWALMGDTRSRGYKMSGTIKRSGWCSDGDDHDMCFGVTFKGPKAASIPPRILACQCECHGEWTTEKIREAVNAYVDSPRTQATRNDLQ